MNALLKSIGATAAFILIWLGPTAFVVWEMGNQVDFWHANSEFHARRSTYLFEGAKARGLLDICNGPDGQPGVFYKEDCLP